jgi:hypothetical protein
METINILRSKFEELENSRQIFISELSSIDNRIDFDKAIKPYNCINGEISKLIYNYIHDFVCLIDIKKSVGCSLILQLMDTRKYSNNYRKALRIALLLCPNVDKVKLENELNLYL